MILFTTWQKLVAKDANVYRVDFDAVYYQGELVIQPFSEHYATKPQAEKARGYFKGTITEVKAASYNPLYAK